MSVVSSQGFSAYGVSDVTKCTAKVTRSASNARLDASTLGLAHGSNRVYEDGLIDSGSNDGGTVVTVSMEGLGDEKPEAGSTITVEGKTCKCMESSSDDSAGELKKWSASYTSDFTD
jgi:hypothetical protein